MAAMNAKKLLLPVLLLVVAFAGGICEARLRTDFYKWTCPQVETIVRNVVRQKFQQTFVTVPGVLRLFFHDCFVEGCDGSVIIASTPPTNTAEKDYTDNLSLAGDGFDTVMKAKAAVEAACPGRVSCADILALATREVVGLAQGPYYAVELGRRDGRVSMASHCPGNLPTPTSNVDGLMAIFSRKGLNLTDLVALSGGGHTLGFAHCTKITDRLYRTGGPDPTLNSSYVSQLQAECPRNVDPTIAINQDPITPRIFDNVYYKNLQKSMGLFKSDQVLYNDPRTRAMVNALAANPAAFQAAFVNSITKLGRVGVKTGRQGEIHRDCSRIN